MPEMKPVSEKEFETKTTVGPIVTLNSDSGKVSIDVEKFIKFGSVSKEVKIGDMVIHIKTLTDKERTVALSGVAIDENDSVMEYIKKTKIPLLSHAITKIGDTDFSSPEAHLKLKEYLDQAQSTAINLLWAAYSDLTQEQMQLFEHEELKKK